MCPFSPPCTFYCECLIHLFWIWCGRVLPYFVCYVVCYSPVCVASCGDRGSLIEWSVAALMGVNVCCSMLVPFHTFVCHLFGVCVLWCGVVWYGVVWCGVL